ncbi:MAG: hypothetical protein LC781_21000 [Actinobacteria bacterium]|nr:hypothetical protein [Actinomycetota bacterium]
MSAPTDRFLEELARRSRPPRMDIPDTCTPEFLEYETVKRYADSLDDLTEKERGERLATLEAFAAYVDRTPDEMVEEIYNRETRKYRKRGFYSDNAKAFAAQIDGPQHVQLACSNVIRSFFIANGYRLPPEQPDWM